MEVIFGIDQLRKPLLNPVVTLGNFDGVHLGHQRIFERLREEAKKIRGEAVVITFEPHPLKILFPEHPFPLLTPFKKKMFLIEKTGIEKVLCIEFSSAFAEISPDDFVKDILIQKVNSKKIVVGYNYRFGKGKSGDIQTLKQICKLFNVGLEVVEALTVEDTIVSSSKIRELIKKGEVEMASKLLGRDHLIIGKVIEGSKRGHVLGFPTANLEMIEELYPKVGVYAVDVIWKDQSFNGVANVGFNPTFTPIPVGTKNDLALEVYLLDFDQDIYGEEIQVNFKKRIRDEVRFDSPSHLVEQIQKDIQWAKENVFATRSASQTSST